MILKNIARIHELDINNLSGEFYFSSLIQEGFSKNLLDKRKIENIQMDCFELLRHKTKLYTSGDSCSVPVKVAENLMQSNLYTIGIYLKSIPHADDALEILMKQNVALLYDEGLKIIKRKIHYAKHLHEMVKNNLLQTGNITYTATVIDAIEGFFKLYDPSFGAHEHHITGDYPLSLPVTDLVGIEFIIEYLQRIYYENKFCCCFSSDKIELLMRSYHKDYEELVFNIFQVLLTTSLGSILVKAPASNLTLNQWDIDYLKDNLKGCSLNEMEMLFYNCYITLITQLDITNEALLNYIEESLDDVAGNIHSAMNLNQPELVFVCAKNPAKEMKIDFSFGDKMDDSLFRKVTAEITSCRYSSDKISLILESIKSLADLEDICLHMDMSDDELREIFSKLAPVELGAFIHRHLKDDDIEAEELTSRESAFKVCLEDFIDALPEERKLMVLKISEVIVI